MKTRNKSTEQDPFSRKIRDKLVDYSPPVEAGSWDELEERLKDQPRKITVLWPQIWGISVAASIASAILFLYLKQPSHENSTSVPYHAERTEESLPSEKALQPPAPSTLQAQLLQNQSNRRSSTASEIAFHEPDVAATEPPMQEPQTPPVVEETRRETPPAVRLNPPTEVLPDEELPAFPRKNRKRSGSFGLHVSSGSGLYASNNTLSAVSNDHPPMFSPSSGGGASYQTNISSLKLADFGKVVHRPPVSIGLSVRKQLNDVFSIESGLTYSYLYSTFEDGATSQDASMTLHYLGIPVNLSVELFPRSRSLWKVYFSAGGMVEKGLYAHYVRNSYGKGVDVTDVSNEIGGLQWSVQAAVGLSYKLHRDYSLFIEPKVSYYLDNNQPESARTVHPFTPGLSVGLRHTWK